MTSAAQKHKRMQSSTPAEPRAGTAGARPMLAPGAAPAEPSGAFDPRITAYFGDAVLRAGFMAVPHLFMRHYRQLGLSSTLAMFLLQIMESTWDFADPPRSTADLARRMGVDKRTIRKYSEEVASLGLLVLYDQFDASGAQIENGYDLSPLLSRLAAFAPEPQPAGTVRRIARDQAPAAPVPPPAQTIRPTPGPNDPPRPRIARSAPPPAQTIRPVPDRTIQGGRIERSGLNRSQRIPKTQEPCIMHDAAGTEPDSHEPQAAGRSLRLGRDLSAAEVAQSSGLLARMAIDEPVRGLLAAALGPAEVWALRLHSRAKRWPVPLLVSQVYDKTTRQAKPATQLTAAHDAVGDKLAALDPAHAEQVVQLVGEHCPTRPASVLDAPLLREHPDLLPVADAAWTLLAELRGHGTVPLRQAPTPPPAVADPEDALVATWQAILDRLRGLLPGADVDVWLASAQLLALDATGAVVGTPNIFVRDQVVRCYAEPIRTALHDLTRLPLPLEIVVGGP